MTHIQQAQTGPAVRRLRRAGLFTAAALALLVASLPALGTSVAVASDPRGPAEAVSMQLVAQSTGAQTYWQAGFTGKGIDIAIIDTGVAPVAGLDAPGKLIYGPDLSFES